MAGSKHVTAADVRSEEWRRLAAHIDDRINELRGQLESIESTEAQTNSVRGRIAELRRLATLPADLKTPQKMQRTSMVRDMIPPPLDRGI